MNLVFGGLVAAMGSADRYLGQLDSLLGRGDPERSFAIAEQMDASMGAPVHRAETLAAHVLHHRRHGPRAATSPPSSARRAAWRRRWACPRAAPAGRRRARPRTLTGTPTVSPP